MPSKYLYTKPDGKVYNITGGAFTEVGVAPPTPAMFVASGNDAIDMVKVKAEPHIDVHVMSNDIGMYGAKLNAIAVYVGKTVIQNYDYTPPTFTSFSVKTKALPASATLRMLISFDSGVTWKVCRSGVWSTIELTSIATGGMTVSELQAINNALFMPQYSGNVRLAYYIEQANSTDVLVVDTVRLNF